MNETLDSYRFVRGATRRVLKAWAAREPRREIPWTALRKPLGACTVAAISSAGVALKSDRPFDQQGERDNPWWGDPSHRVIPRTATERDVDIYHLHIDTRPAEKDLNCILPLQRLAELEALGEIGGLAPSHFSIMGYQLRTQALVEDTVPKIIDRLRAEHVDVALLFPV